MKLKLYLQALLFVTLLLIIATVAYAQDVPLTSATASWFDEAGAFLARLVFLAAILQTAINALKPAVIDPIQARLPDERAYLIFMYVFRGIVTVLAYFGLWGGIEATRASAPNLLASVPNEGVAFAAIALIVLGQETIHALMDWLYTVKEGVGKLELPLDSAKSVTVNAQRTPDTPQTARRYP